MDADTFSALTTDPWMMGKRLTNINLKVHDIPGEANFYRISARSISYNTDPYDSKVYINPGQISFEKEFFTDQGIDGKEINLKTIYGIDYLLVQDSSFIVFYLLNTEKSYFLYHKSLSDYVSGDNPFSEASAVYSNITGGLGIFASYTVDSLIVRLK